MGYFYRETEPGKPATPAVDAAMAAAAAGGPSKQNTMAVAIGLLTAKHGPEVADVLVRYASNLKNALHLLDEVQRAGSEAGMAGSLRSAAARLRTVAECLEELPGEAVTPTLIATIPGETLARILAAGFEAEADAAEDLVDCVFPPRPEDESAEGAKDAAAPGCAGSNSHPNDDPG